MSNNLSELSSLLALYLCDHTKSVADLQGIFELCLVTREKTQLIQHIMQTLNSPNVSRQQLYNALTLIQNNQSFDHCQGYFQQGNYPENEQYRRYDYEQHNYSDNNRSGTGYEYGQHNYSDNNGSATGYEYEQHNYSDNKRSGTGYEQVNQDRNDQMIPNISDEHTWFDCDESPWFDCEEPPKKKKKMKSVIVVPEYSNFY